MTEFVSRILSAEGPRLWSLGQAGYILKSRSGELLGVDLYLSDCVEADEPDHLGHHRLQAHLLSPTELTLDTLVTTHAHYDHFDPDSVPGLLSGGKTLLLASERCREELEKCGLSAKRARFAAPGDRIEAGDFAVECLPCDHGEAAPDAFGLRITVDGKTVVMAGDTCLHPEYAPVYREKGAVDLFIAPINGTNGNLSETDCAVLTALVRPARVLPSHFGMFAAQRGDPGLFLEQMRLRAPEIPVLLLAMGESTEL